MNRKSEIILKADKFLKDRDIKDTLFEYGEWKKGGLSQLLTDFAEQVADWQSEHVIIRCKDELLKQTFLMKHTNGYPSEAVPKATILSLPALMKQWLENFKKQQNDNKKLK